MAVRSILDIYTRTLVCLQEAIRFFKPQMLQKSLTTTLWDEKLRLRRYDAVRQRIDINCVLPHLDRSETEKYIQSHLNYSGITEQDLFSRRAVDEIFRISCGIPRLVNRICEKSLMYGSQQGLRVIDDQDVLYVSEHEMLKGGNPS